MDLEALTALSSVTQVDGWSLHAGQHACSSNGAHIARPRTIAEMQDVVQHYDNVRAVGGYSVLPVHIRPAADTKAPLAVQALATAGTALFSALAGRPLSVWSPQSWTVSPHCELTGRAWRLALLAYPALSTMPACPCCSSQSNTLQVAGAPCTPLTYPINFHVPCMSAKQENPVMKIPCLLQVAVQWHL